MVVVAELAEGANTLRVCVADAAANRGATTASISRDTTPPETQIDSHPAALSASAAAAFEFSGSDAGGSGVASYECRRDSTEPGAWGACASPQSYASLPDGPHSFQVRAVDVAGNADGSPAAFSWSVDTTAPSTTIDAGPSGLTNDSTPSFEFHSSEAGSDFECSIDTGAPAWGACSGPGSETPPGALPDGPHTFRVRAADAAGNTGAAATREFTVDTAAPDAPQLSATAPPSPAGESSPKLIGSAPAGSTVRIYEGPDCTGTPVATVSAAALEAGVTVPVPGDSTTALRATATSSAGNLSPCSAPLTYTEDSTAPQTQVDGHPAALSGSASAQLEFSGSDPGGSGVASFECRLDSSQAADWHPCASPKQYSGLADGSHKFEVRAIDRAGNADASPASFEWTVDATPPGTQIDSHPAALSAASAAKLEFSGSDAGGSGVVGYQCRLDSAEAAAWASCTSPKTYSSLADGSHRFEARAVDQAGNADQSPATFSWSVDTTPPETQIDSHPAALSASAAAAFEFSGSDAGGSGVASYECRRDSTEPGAWGACASPQSYASLPDGPHSFQVRAVDVAGNADGSPAAFSWSVDTTAPSTTIDAGPSGLTNDSTPSFEFHSSEAGSDFECSIDTGAPAWGACSGPGSETPPGALPDGPHTFRVRAADAAGNTGAAATREFTVDTAAPDAPQLSATAPPSPAGESSPKLIGSAPAGSTVRIYEGPDCTGTPVATVSAAALEAGVTVPVPGDSTTALRATATSSAGNLSPCSAPLTYTEDSTAPQTQVDGHPAALSGSASAQLEFSGSDPGGSGVASFECRLDSSQAADWHPCASPKQYSGLADGSHKFEVRAIDRAGNADASPASFEWTVDATPPGTQIDSHPAALSAASAAKLEFSGSDAGGSGVVGYQCRLDSAEAAAWASCTSPKTYSSLADGSHRFEARAVDQAGNADQSPATFSWSVDTTPPETQIDSHPAALSASAAAAFEFSGSDAGGSGVASYECRRDSTEPGAWGACASPQSYASLPDGPHSFQVRAVDVAGNADGSPAAFSWSVDTTAPSTTIDAGPSGLTNDSTPSFEFHSSEAGSDFECSIDTGAPAWGACSGPGSETPPGALPDGPHTFRVRAADAAGNTGAAATREFTVDTAAPDAPQLSATAPPSPAGESSPKLIGSAPAGSTVRIYEGPDCTGTPVATVSAAALEAGVTVPVPGDSTTALRATATSSAGNLSPCSAPLTYTEDSTAPQTQVDGHPAALSGSASAQLEFSGSDPGGSGVASFECRLDSSQAADWHPCASPKQYSGLADGSHKFEVRAIDRAGNADASPASFEWTVDATPPGTQIDSHPAALSAASAAKLEFSGSDAGGSGVVGYQCRLDSAEAAAWASCTSPKTYSSLADGSHRFEARAVDQAGNADQSPATFSWSVDTTPPETQIDSHPAALSASAAAAFEFSGSDAGGSGVASYECRRDSTEPGAWGACASPQSYASLPDGPHSFQVRAVDVAGNADGSPAAFSWSVDTTAPSTTIDAGPSGLTNDSTPSFEFHSSEAGSDFECSIDTGAPAWGACSGPGSETPPGALPDGPHTFRVRAADAAGNTGAAATREFTVDTAAPDAPQLSATAPPSPAGESSPKLIGSAPAGSTVRIYEGPDCTGTPVATVSAAALEAGVTVPVPGDSTTALRATATSSAGNLSPCSAPLTYTEDSTAPQTQVDGHPAALSGSASAQLEFSGSDPGGSGVASFECRLDSSQAADWHPCASPKQYSGLADGSHKFEVRAIDRAGNADASPASFEWTVDATPPGTQIDSHPAALSAASAAKLEFSGSDAGGSGVVGYQCRLDSAEAAAWASCTSPKTYSSLADGSHRFEARAVDQAGNADQSPATFSWSVDTTPPETQIDSHPAALSASAAAAFEFSGSDAGGSGVASYECRRDSTEPGAWGACASPQSYASLPDGPHSFQVRAVDVAGNADGSPAAFSWSVDTTAPSTTIDAGPSGLTNDSTPSFEFHSSEAGSDFECSIDTGAPAWGACSGPGSETPPGALPDGPHTFRVRAADAAGNTGAAATREFTVDTAAPDAPQLSATAPPSPAGESSPKLIGSAPAGSTVRIYEGPDCTGTPVATVSAAALEAGVTVPVPGDSTTALRATATSSAGNLSPCSAPLTYTEDSTAPQTQVDGHPAALSGSASAQLEFSGSDPGGSGVASFECRLDSSQAADWHPCASPKQYSGLADGSHKFEVRAIDRAGNADASPASFEWTVDATPPGTQIDSHPAALSAASAAKLEFSGSDAGGSGVVGYQCRLDSAEAAAWASCTSPKTYSSLADGSHRFEARAVDQAGNADQSPATFSWSVDTTPPETQIDSHPAALSASAAAAFEFSGSDAGGSGVASYECRRDSTEPGAWGACASPQSYASLPDGPHSFQVRAVDVAGNADGSPAAFSWSVDTTAPSTTIDAGPSGLTNDSTPSFEFHSSEAGSDFECSIDTGAPAWGACSGPGSETPPGALPDGPHTFRVRAADAAGNTGAAATREFTVDTAAPDAPQLSATAPPSPAGESSPKLIGSAPAGSTVRIYEGPDCTGTPVATVSAAALEAGVTVPVPGDSTTALRATATSSAGNLSPCSAPLTYTEDSTAPQTQVDGHPAALSGSASAQLEFSGSDPGGSGVASFECRLDSSQAADWHPCASPKQYSGLADGSHKFEVRAIDRAGNADASPASFEWTVDATPQPEPGPSDQSAPSTPTPSSPPTSLALRAPVRLLHIEYDVHRGNAFLVFEVPSPGTLSASAPSFSPPKNIANAAAKKAVLRRRSHQIVPKRIRVVHAGKARLPIRLTPVGRRLLRERRKVKVRVRISFKAKGVETVSRMIAITLRRPELRRPKRAHRRHSRKGP